MKEFKLSISDGYKKYDAWTQILENNIIGRCIKNFSEYEKKKYYDIYHYKIRNITRFTYTKTIADRDDKTNCMDKISLWYWNTISGDNYSGSTDSKGEADFKIMSDWFDNSDVKPFNNIEVEDFNTTKTSSAIYKGIMCLIAK